MKINIYFKKTSLELKIYNRMMYSITMVEDLNQDQDIILDLVIFICRRVFSVKLYFDLKIFQ